MPRPFGKPSEPTPYIVAGLGLIVLAVLLGGWWWLIGLFGAGLAVYGIITAAVSAGDRNARYRHGHRR